MADAASLLNMPAVDLVRDAGLPFYNPAAADLNTGAVLWNPTFQAVIFSGGPPIILGLFVAGVVVRAVFWTEARARRSGSCFKRIAEQATNNGTAWQEKSTWLVG